MCLRLPHVCKKGKVHHFKLLILPRKFPVVSKWDRWECIFLIPLILPFITYHFFLSKQYCSFIIFLIFVTGSPLKILQYKTLL